MYLAIRNFHSVAKTGCSPIKMLQSGLKILCFKNIRIITYEIGNAFITFNSNFFYKKASPN